MARCETCGNEYDKAFGITMPGEDETHVFDSFECAIHSLAPTCAHCGCRVIGHGVEADGTMYCCAHCAGQMGEHGLRDRDGDTASVGTSGVAPTRPPADE